MTRPPAWVYVIGNPVSYGLLCLAFVACTGLYFTSGQAGVPAALCFLAASAAYRAHARLRAFQAWERDWAAMEGGARPARSRAPPGDLKKLAPFAAWGLLACFSLAAAGSPGMGPVVGLFWLLSGIGGGVWLVRKFRNPAPGRGGATQRVAVCLPPPSQPATLHSAYAALPQSLWGLFQRQ